MALTRGLIRNASTTPLDARLADMALVTANADGSPRPGVLSQDGANLLTALATMNVAVAADADFVTTKGKADGVAIFTNDGIVNVPIPAAPASNSRIHTIWVKHEDNTTGDAASLPIFGVASGAAAAIPTPIAIPTGALELGTLRVYSGTTAANGGANTLTNTFQMTSLRGTPVPFRTKVEANAWTTATNGQRARVIADGSAWESISGAWSCVGKLVVSKDSATDVSITPSDVTFNNIDGTNLKLDFVAPASGKVIFKANVASAIIATGGLILGLKAAGVDVVGSPVRVMYVTAAGSVQSLASPTWPISGLTPGTAYSYTLTAKRLGAGTVEIKYGQANQWGLISFSVEAL